MQIRRKLTISTFVAVLFLLMLGGFSFLLINQIVNNSQEVIKTQKFVLRLSEIQGLTQNILSLTELHIKSEDAVSMGLIAGKIEELEDQLQSTVAGDDGILQHIGEGSGIQEFVDNWEQFHLVLHRVIGLSDLFSQQAANELLKTRGLRLFKKSRQVLDERMDHTKKVTARLSKRADAAEFASLVFIVTFTLVIVMVAVFGGLVLSRSITNPLIKLADYLRSNTLSEDQPFADSIKQDNNELRTLVQSLEVQVQNRTRELVNTNQLLENEIDIRKLREVEIKASEDKYRQIFNNTAAWMAYTSIDGNFIETNISLMKHLGYSDEELKQMNLRDLVPEKFYPEYEQFFRRLRENGKANGLMTLVGKTGKSFVLDYQSNIILNDQSQSPDMAVHFARDITLQKAAERAFEQSELRFQELVNALPLPYFITDQNQKMVFANRMTRETFDSSNGIGAGDAGAETEFTNILVPEDRQTAGNRLEAFGAQQKSGWHQYNCQRRDGSVFPCEILTTPVEHSQRNAKYQHIVVDLSERLEKEELKKQKEIVEAANQAISEWIAFVAHELRNPLGGIISFARIGQMKADAAQKGKIRSFFDQIYSAASRLEVLLSDLLDYSKMETGQLTLRQEKVDLRYVVREVELENEALLVEKGLMLVRTPTEVEAEPFELICDRYRIGQVIRNIVSNAIKFTPSGKKIEISLEKTAPGSALGPTGIQVNIADEGIGIPEDQIELIFNKYKQSRRTRAGEGTGLGLPICKKIVEAHDGRIWIQNSDAQGTTFSFVIPTRS